MPSDAHRLIGSLIHAKAQLHLDTADLCLLVALRARAEVASLVSFEESLLVDTFEEILRAHRSGGRESSQARDACHPATARPEDARARGWRRPDSARRVLADPPGYRPRGLLPKAPIRNKLIKTAR